MAKYGGATYGRFTYGEAPRLAYSVEPIGLTVLDFDKVSVSWNPASGTYTRMRLVRNPIGFPETAEDGIIVWEQNLTEAQKAAGYTSLETIARTYDSSSPLIDGEQVPAVHPVVPGSQAFYTMFLFTTIWVEAGYASTTIPSQHGLHKKLVDSLPKVFTSLEQGPFGVVDTNSTLYNFLYGMSLTAEESLTFVDLLVPSHTYATIPVELIGIRANTLGLVLETGLPVKNQKRLIREARYMYSRKGTETSLSTYIESLTGYPPTITLSTNKLLTIQDSTFYNSIGNWTATGGTIVASTLEIPALGVATNIDSEYACKITASGVGSMSLGNTDVIHKAIPVTKGTQYTLSCQIKSPLSAGTITPKIYFYDDKGVVIGSAHSGTPVAANATWQVISQTITADASSFSSLATLGTIVGGSGYTNGSYPATTLTRVSGVVPSTLPTANITVAGGVVTAVTLVSYGENVGTNTVFSASGLGAGTGFSVPVSTINNYSSGAVYAGIGFAWSASGVYYVDMVCLQEGASASYDEARAIDIFLGPNKTNLIKNPSFETNFSNWTSTGAPTLTNDTDVSTLSYAGVKSGKIVAAGAWSLKSNTAPVEPGQYYSVSALVKTVASILVTLNTRNGGGVIDTYSATIPGDTTATVSGTSGGFTVTVGSTSGLTVGQKVKSGTGLSTSSYITGINGLVLTMSVANTGAVSGSAVFEHVWENYSLTFPVPANSTATTIEVVFSGTATTSYIDSVHLEKSVVPTDYIDGSLPVQFGAVWEGAANASYSHVYYSKPMKLPRMGRTMVDWVPTNSWWRLRTYGGLEYTNLTV